MATGPGGQPLWPAEGKKLKSHDAAQKEQVVYWVERAIDTGMRKGNSDRQIALAIYDIFQKELA